MTSETLNRTAKVFLDAGAASVDEAYDRLGSFRLAVSVGPDASRSRAGQAAVLTAVNAGARCLLGGVTVTGALGAPLAAPFPGARTLAEAVVHLGGLPGGTAPDGTPALVVGDGPPRTDTDVTLYAAADGWNGGVAPDPGGLRRDATPLAGVVAGAVAVSEAFQHLAGLSAVAARRPAGLALWAPGADWRTADPGPALSALPSGLWLVGLGHLGQAYLWSLGLLPYASPHTVDVVLQDTDWASEANRSTSPLTFAGDVGLRKTRVAAAWAEGVGFTSHIVERRFDGGVRRQPAEPALALFGVDNPAARSVSEGAGFARVVDGGLGAGAGDFLSFQVNGFPGPDEARNVWGRADEPALVGVDGLGPAYRGLAEEARRRGEDACGVVRLAGVAVGASFVGLAASAVVVAEAVRLAMGEPGLALVDGTLDDIGRVTGVPASRRPCYGLGFTEALR